MQIRMMLSAIGLCLLVLAPVKTTGIEHFRNGHGADIAVSSLVGNTGLVKADHSKQIARAPQVSVFVEDPVLQWLSSDLGIKTGHGKQHGSTKSPRKSSTHHKDSTEWYIDHNDWTTSATLISSSSSTKSSTTSSQASTKPTKSVSQHTKSDAEQVLSFRPTTVITSDTEPTSYDSTQTVTVTPPLASFDSTQTVTVSPSPLSYDSTETVTASPSPSLHDSTETTAITSEVQSSDDVEVVTVVKAVTVIVTPESKSPDDTDIVTVVETVMATVTPEPGSVDEFEVVTITTNVTATATVTPQPESPDEVEVVTAVTVVTATVTAELEFSDEVEDVTVFTDLTATVTPEPPAPTDDTQSTQSVSEPTDVKIYTKLVTKYLTTQQTDVRQNTATYTVDGQEVPITASTQTVGDSVFVVQPSQPKITAMPLPLQPDIPDECEEELKDMSIKELRSVYPEISWSEVELLVMSAQKRDPDLDFDEIAKDAFILMLEDRYPGGQACQDLQRWSYSSTTEYVRLPSTANSTALDWPMTADPVQKYKMYDPQLHPIPPTEHCHDHKGLRRWPYRGIGNAFRGRRYNRKQCSMERCMWKHMRPINITTVSDLAMFRGPDDSVTQYWTATTEVTGVHWGTTETTGLYYPTKIAAYVMTKNLAMTTTIVRATPGWLDNNRNSSRGHGSGEGETRVHGDPTCSDAGTCYTECEKQASRRHKRVKVFWWCLFAILVPLCLILLCCGCLRSRHRRLKEQRRSELRPNTRGFVTEKPKRPSTSRGREASRTNPTSMVNNSSTEATAGGPNGTTVESITQNEGEGRGTTGRRAEEGRGHVQFDETATPGVTTQTPQVVVEDAVETVPIHDGADARPTGMQAMDLGSLRGRKRSRPELSKMTLALWGR